MNVDLRRLMGERLQVAAGIAMDGGMMRTRKVRGDRRGPTVNDARVNMFEVPAGEKRSFTFFGQYQNTLPSYKAMEVKQSYARTSASSIR